jgi:hypothetical protein
LAVNRYRLDPNKSEQNKHTRETVPELYRNGPARVRSTFARRLPCVSAKGLASILGKN